MIRDAEFSPPLDHPADGPKLVVVDDRGPGVKAMLLPAALILVSALAVTSYQLRPPLDPGDLPRVEPAAPAPAFPARPTVALAPSSPKQGQIQPDGSDLPESDPTGRAAATPVNDRVAESAEAPAAPALDNDPPAQPAPELPKKPAVAMVGPFPDADELREGNRKPKNKPAGVEPDEATPEAIPPAPEPPAAPRPEAVADAEEPGALDRLPDADRPGPEPLAADDGIDPEAALAEIRAEAERRRLQAKAADRDRVEVDQVARDRQRQELAESVIRANADRLTFHNDLRSILAAPGGPENQAREIQKLCAMYGRDTPGEVETAVNLYRMRAGTTGGAIQRVAAYRRLGLPEPRILDDVAHDLARTIGKRRGPRTAAEALVNAARRLVAIPPQPPSQISLRSETPPTP